MNKLQTLSEMEAELKKLQSGIDALKKDIASEKERVFGIKVEGGSDKEYFIPEPYHKLNIGKYLANCEEHRHYDLPLFATAKEAEEFSEALHTFLRLRTMEGVVAEKLNVPQYYINLNEKGCGFYIERWWNGCNQMSPTFKDRQSALNVIDTIGEDKLIKMFEVLGGIPKDKRH